MGQDVRDVGNVVEKFTTPPTRCRGNVPLRSFIVGVGPPFPSADFRVGLRASKALGIGTGTVQRVLMEQPRPFDVDVAEAVRLPLRETEMAARMAWAVVEGSPKLRA